MTIPTTIGTRPVVVRRDNNTSAAQPIAAPTIDRTTIAEPLQVPADAAAPISCTAFTAKWPLKRKYQAPTTAPIAAPRDRFADRLTASTPAISSTSTAASGR